MRLFKLTSLMFFFALSLFGQEEQPLHPKFSETYCTPPELVAKAVVHYEGYSKAYLEFAGDNVAQGGITVKSLDGQIVENIPVVDGGALVTNLPSEKMYEILVPDDCEGQAVVGAFSTKTDDASTYGIELSDRMYRAIVDFQKSENEVPLGQYLGGLESVSPYERLAFYQQYFLGGEKFQTDQGPTLPDMTTPPPPEGSCLCRFLFRTTQLASPAVLMAGVLGTVHEESVNSNGGIKLTWDNGAKYWWFRNNKGAAKWHYAWTEGFGTGGDHKRYIYSVVDSNMVSPHMGQLAYNFLCTNYEQVPRGCECEKQIRLFYRYDSRAVAHAELLGSSINDRTAEARSQDVGVVTLSVAGQPLRVLDAGDVRAEAECSSGVNNEWFVNYVDVAANIVLFALAASDTTGIGQTQMTQIVEDLAQDIKTLIQTPFTVPKECETVQVDATLAYSQSPEVIDLPPNTEAFLNVFSFTNQRVGGKRKWFSYGGVESGFYLTGIVPGGRVEGGSEACCTKKIANWVYASEQSVPNSTQNLANQVSGILGLWAPGGWPVDPFSGGVVLPSEYGWMEAVDECNEYPGSGLTGPPTEQLLAPGAPAATATGHDAPTDPVQQYEKEEGFEDAPGFTPEQMMIFDLNGRVLHVGNEIIAPEMLGRFMAERGIGDASGIYFVHLLGEGQRRTFKVYISK